MMRKISKNKGTLKLFLRNFMQLSRKKCLICVSILTSREMKSDVCRSARECAETRHADTVHLRVLATWSAMCRRIKCFFPAPVAQLIPQHFLQDSEAGIQRN